MQPTEQLKKMNMFDGLNTSTHSLCSLTTTELDALDLVYHLEKDIKTEEPEDAHLLLLSDDRPTEVQEGYLRSPELLKEEMPGLREHDQQATICTEEDEYTYS